MLGFSAEAVAVAVRRALTDATTWSNYEWQIVHDDAVPPRLHLALDEVLADPGRRRPPQARRCASGSGTSRPS